MSRIRLQRLEADSAEFELWLLNGGARYVEVLETIGRPTSTWRLRLNVPGVVGLSYEDVLFPNCRRVGPLLVRDDHTIRVMMPEDYPFRPPIVNFLERVLHPNVFPIGRLCWGIAESDPRWWRGGEGLGTLMERLLQLIVAEPSCTNPNSPANPEAVPTYREHAALFPLLKLSFRTAGTTTLHFREATS